MLQLALKDTFSFLKIYFAISYNFVVFKKLKKEEIKRVNSVMCLLFIHLPFIHCILVLGHHNSEGRKPDF